MHQTTQFRIFWISPFTKWPVSSLRSQNFEKMYKITLKVRSFLHHIVYKKNKLLLRQKDDIVKVVFAKSAWVCGSFGQFLSTG